jgi:hypothetical protein
MALVAIDDQGRLDPQGARLVDTTAQAPLAGLLAAARAAGHPTRINWAFRSHSQQEEMFLHTAEIGRVARPGHSEHELGLAVDLDYPDDAALAFLLREAPARGFVQSYPDGKQKVTGYRHEPWHFRFVGAAIAREVTAAGLSLEEFFQQHPKQGRSGRCEDCPAAASREPCRGLDARGRCEGSVLRWCFEGVATAVDCSTSERRCGWRDEATGNDCLPARGQ